MNHAALLVKFLALVLTVQAENGEGYKIALIAIVPVVAILLILAVVAIVILSVILVKLFKYYERDQREPVQAVMNNTHEMMDDTSSINYANPIYDARVVRESDITYQAIGQPLQGNECEQTGDMSWGERNLDKQAHREYPTPHRTAMEADYTEPTAADYTELSAADYTEPTAADYMEPSVSPGVRIPWSEKSPGPTYENCQPVTKGPYASGHGSPDTGSVSDDIDHPEPSYANVSYRSRSPVLYLADKTINAPDLNPMAMRPHSLPPDGTDALFPARGTHHAHSFHITRL